MIQNTLFSFFFTTSEVNFLWLVSDLKKGKWEKNVKKVNRQPTVIKKYLYNKEKIAVIPFLQNKIFSPLDIMGK
jgi:hypothetical protein